MNIDQVNEPVMNLYDLLAQLQELIKLFGKDFKVEAKGLDFAIQLPQGKIDELRAKYVSVQEAVVREANRIPKLERLG